MFKGNNDNYIVFNNVLTKKDLLIKKKEFVKQIMNVTMEKSKTMPQMLVERFVTSKKKILRIFTHPSRAGGICQSKNGTL